MARDFSGIVTGCFRAQKALLAGPLKFTKFPVLGRTFCEYYEKFPRIRFFGLILERI